MNNKVHVAWRLVRTAGSKHTPASFEGGFVHFFTILQASARIGVEPGLSGSCLRLKVAGQGDGLLPT